MTGGSCAGFPAHKVAIERMVGLETAARFLGGQKYLAGTLGIGDRALRAKLAAERGISYSDLTLAAKDLRVRAAQLIAHADKLLALAEGAQHD